MEDRIEQILERHIDDLRKSLHMMESGKLRTHTNNEDTTQESIIQSQTWITELEGALERHRSRNA